MDGKPKFKLYFLYPRYWFTWFWLGLVWLTVQLPYPALLFLGKHLGRWLLPIAKRRRRIAETNLRLCFPDLSEQQRRELLVKHFESMGIAIFEIGIAWWWPERRLKKIATIEGLENLEKAGDRGAILLAMHLTTLEVGASLLSRLIQIDGMYRPHKNPVFDFVQRRGRERHHKTAIAISRNDVRGIIKNLRSGHYVWYAPDQDLGRRHSIFVPFFGIPAATLTTTAKLAKSGHALVIPFTQNRLADGSGYKLTIFPPFSDYPSDDLEADTRRINAFLEEQIIKQPEQYLWVHRRFKTRPEGDPSLYNL